MSSFPFYITPSEFDEQVAEHELLLKEDESSMRWSSRNVDEADRWIRKKWWFAIISAISFLFIGLGMILDLEMWINLEGLALATIVSLSVVWWASYISYAVDDKFDYILSDKGLALYQTFGEPEWAPQLVKGIGFFGSIASIILIFIIGPKALVGVGAFMLVSFGLVNRKPHDIHKKVVLSEQFMCSRYNRDRGVICIFSRSDACEPSTKHDDSVFRVLGKSWLYIFPDNDDRFEKVLKLLKDDLSLECIESNDKSVLFDWEKAPQEFKSFRHQRAHYSMEDAVTKRDHPAPPPKKPR
ncbi:MULTISPECIES: hypothetical protein [Vibrio]|uniref:hypothetical protein n=1 Tax=Vibrio TaxID=662 RepID=UPI0002E02492|nr:MULTISPECIES: hypothetical protein [Vibrio]NOH60393.1 hypothetical protein [Vibrio sp. RE88]